MAQYGRWRADARWDDLRWRGNVRGRTHKEAENRAASHILRNPYYFEGSVSVEMSPMDEAATEIERRWAGRREEAKDREIVRLAAAWGDEVSLVAVDYGFSPRVAAQIVAKAIYNMTSAASAWDRGDVTDDALVRMVLGAADRHQHTDYDERIEAMVDAGYSGEDAVRIAREDLGLIAP